MVLRGWNFPVARMEPKPMHDRRTRLRTIEPVLIAALIVGFALAVGVALGMLDAVVKDASSSLSAIAAIGH
jgi:ABC-type antimicrobial peptide transport system permease subunit